MNPRSRRSASHGVKSWASMLPAGPRNWKRFCSGRPPSPHPYIVARQGDPDIRGSWESIHYWYWEHWKFFRSETKTSIVQGVAIFLSLFETDAKVRKVFCPPKELYEGKPSPSDPDAKVLPPFDELIESGKVVGLNFPTALNPALAKIIGTMMKVDYQRAVLLRIPRMEDSGSSGTSGLPFSSAMNTRTSPPWAVTIPTGDERFLSLSRQPKCIPLVATQSISSLKDALPNEGVKTLLQAFRTKVFLTTSDPDTARYGVELCGKADKTRSAIPFPSPVTMPTSAG